MPDNKLIDIILDKLEKIQETQEIKHEKLHNVVSEIKEKQIHNSIILAQMEKDIPEIKKDLFEHKEGVIQNRAHIKHLDDSIIAQDAVVEEALRKYSDEVAPVIDHVRSIQEIPQKIIKFSKVVGAIALTMTSIITIWGYLNGWFK